MPIANQTRKLLDGSYKVLKSRLPLKVESADFDLSKMEGIEEDKIKVMMLQSAAEYDSKRYFKSQYITVPSFVISNLIAVKKLEAILKLVKFPLPIVEINVREEALDKKLPFKYL